MAARILPDDGIVDRLAAVAIPGDHRLALISDSERLRIAGAGGQLLHMAEQLEPIMLDPTRHGKNLAVLESSQGLEDARGIEAVGLAACGPLIDGNDGGHA